MKQNVGTMDRALRALAAIGMLVASVVAPLPGWLRIGALGGTGAYLLLTALVGSCVGYRLIGRSTCPR